MTRGAPPGKSRRGYDGLSHDDRANLSRHLERLRLQAGWSQADLAEAAEALGVCEVGANAVRYFESHPREPLAREKRRRQLSAICSALAKALGMRKADVVGPVNQYGGGVG